MSSNPGRDGGGALPRKIPQCCIFQIHYERMYVNSRVIGMCVLIGAVQPDHAPPLRIRSDFMNNNTQSCLAQI